MDQVVRFKPHKLIVAQRLIRDDEPWFKGHFPQKAIMPGALVLDGSAQTSGLLMGFSKKATEEERGDIPKIFYLAASNVKFTAPAFPGETLDLIAETGEQFDKLYSYNVEALAGRKSVAKGTLMLAAMEGSI